MPHKKLFLSLLTLFFLQITVAQKLNAIDQKGTKITVINNKVTDSSAAPAISKSNSNDIWFDSKVTTAGTLPTVNIFDGKKWVSLEHKGKPGSIFFASSDSIPTENNSQLFWENSTENLIVGATGNTSTKLTVNGKVLSNTALELKGTLIDALSSPGTAGQVLTSTSSGTTWQTNTNWLISGNSGTTEDNFLGTIDDVKMSIRSKGLPMLEFGLRKTLDLIDVGRNDYTTEDQPLVYVGGDSITSALQFAASGAQFYKPMFFTTKNGSFRLKGSAGGTDLFEIGSAGPDNQGRLEFIVGDDGKEPMIFKRFEHNKNVHREFFRVQASDNGENTKTRFGININPDSVAISDSTLAYISVDKGLIANSTLQVNGSISNSTFTTTGALTLTEDHYAIILGGNHQITLPAASGSKGRIYIIKNPTSSSVSLSSSSSYLTNFNVASKIIASGTILWIQSDGANWQQISSTDASNTNELQKITQNVTSGDVTLDLGGGSAKVISAVANNQIKVGTDGGAYLGPTVYTGSFIISAMGNKTISEIPFTPSQITFTAYANIQSFNLDTNNGSTNNVDSSVNTFGGMQGFANANVNSIIQRVIFVGGSGSSINNISRFSSDQHSIGVRYANNNGVKFGNTTAKVTSFDIKGFTILVDSYLDSLVVLYTAYK